MVFVYMPEAEKSQVQVEYYLDGLVQERRNSSALAMELRLSGINCSIWYIRILESITFGIKSLNSLVPGRSECNLKNAVSNFI